MNSETQNLSHPSFEQLTTYTPIIIMIMMRRKQMNSIKLSIIMISIFAWKRSNALLNLCTTISKIKRIDTTTLLRQRQHLSSLSFSSSSSSSSSSSTTTTTTTTTTQYTIQEEGVDPKTLEKTVNKHCENIHVFVKEKPIAAHTKEAFLTLKQELVLNRPVILDSGCGTGKSTLLLGQKYPNHTIIGIDRSIARLAKNVVYNHQKEQQQSSLPPPNNSSSSLPSSSSSSSNIFLIRAELADFWRLWLEESTSSSSSSSSDNNKEERRVLPPIEKHFLLYPNPYPKKKRFQNRWYAHPSFPLLRKLGANEIVVRSNWEAYLKDFALAMELSNQYYYDYDDDDDDDDDETKPKQDDATNDNDENHSTILYTAKGPPELLDPKQPAWTNFEQKYFTVGETCYQITFHKTKKKKVVTK